MVLSVVAGIRRDMEGHHLELVPDAQRRDQSSKNQVSRRHGSDNEQCDTASILTPSTLAVFTLCPV